MDHSADNANIVIKTLLDIKNMYGSKIIRYRHQRPIVTEHILDIKEYIENTYDKKEFYLPPIVLVPNDNDQYEIIDGLHRCVSIAEKINEKHPSLSKPIYIIYKDVQASTIAAMKLFMNINKARPMPRLYFEENYIDKLQDKTKKTLKVLYGSDIINASDKYIMTSKFNQYKLDEIINDKHIEKLIIDNVITGLNNNEISKLIKNKNNSAVDYINVYMEMDVFNNFDSLSNNNKVTLSNFINRVLYTHNNKHVELLSTTILNNIKSIIERWQSVKINRRQHENNINVLEYKPMILGLFPRIPILELESVFINTGLFENAQNNELEGEPEGEPGS